MNDKPKWTAGPWETRDGKKTLFIVQPHQFIESGIYVAEVSLAAWHPVGISMVAREEKKANARLIAAAPELYEALEYALKCCYEGDVSEYEPSSWMAKARAALAKARG